MWSSRFGVGLPVLGLALVCAVICCPARDCGGVNPSRAASLGSESLLLSTQQWSKRKSFPGCHFGYTGASQVWANNGKWCWVRWTWDRHRGLLRSVVPSPRLPNRPEANCWAPGARQHTVPMGGMPAWDILHLLWYGNNINVTIEAEDLIKAWKSQ